MLGCTSIVLTSTSTLWLHTVMSEGYEFDAALQEQAIRVGQESILKLLEGKTYQHGKVRGRDIHMEVCHACTKGAFAGISGPLPKAARRRNPP